MPWYRAPTARRFHLERLFRPASLALIGSDTPEGALVLRNVEAAGFKRPLYTLCAPDGPGVPAFAGLAALAAPPDLAVLTVPPVRLAETLAGLAQIGCTAAVVTGEAPDPAAGARVSGMRVLGPDSFGIAAPALPLNATLAHLPVPAGRAALVAQSAALCRAVLDWAEPNGLGFSHIVGIGDNADIGFAMVLDWLSREPGTGVILLEIESLKNPRAFLSAARAAARGRAVIALRPGARLADPSGEAEAVFEAAMRRAGIIAVTSLGDLLAAGETLTRAKPARGEALAVLSNAPGPGKIAADAALRHGLQLAELAPATREALNAALPGGGAIPSAGPLHIGADNPTRLAEAAALLSAAPEVGGILIEHAPAGESDAVAVAAMIACAQAAKPPLLVCVLGATTGAAHRSRLAEAGLAAFPGAEEGVRGFLRLVQLRRSRAAASELPPSSVLELEPDRDLVRRLFAERRQAALLSLDRDAAARVLGAYGVSIVPMDPAGRGSELLVRVVDDAMFGPAIRFGLRGNAAAGLNGFAFDLPPLNLPLAHSLLARSRIAAISPDHRINGEAIAETLVRVSQLIVDFPEIAGLEIDPLFADAAGVRATDAWMRLRPPGQTGQIAIAPYPQELCEVWEIAGERLVVRPIRPEDAEAHQALFRRLATEDVRYRFFSPLRQLSAEATARMTQIDYDRELAFVAERARDQAIVGVARLVSESERGSSEFAVVVEPNMKHKGVATRLMHRLIDWARARGLAQIDGQILADNFPMQAFAQKLGFSLRHQPGEEDVLAATLKLRRSGNC